MKAPGLVLISSLLVLHQRHAHLQDHQVQNLASLQFPKFPANRNPAFLPGVPTEVSRVTLSAGQQTRLQLNPSWCLLSWTWVISWASKSMDGAPSEPERARLRERWVSQVITGLGKREDLLEKEI